MTAARAGGRLGRGMGRAIFLAGLAAWVALSLKLLPYCFHDLRYLLALDHGGMSGPSDWVHPLFGPLLGSFQALLLLLGYHGRMLIPLEQLNVAVAALALAGLFRLVERLCEDSVTAALAVLLLAFSRGFWEGAVRPDPYALAAAFSLGTLIVLIGRRPGDERRQYALAGFLAGLTIGFHASGLALVPVGVLAVLLESGWTRRGARLLGAFLRGGALACAAGYAAFIAYYRITPSYLKGRSFSHMFSQIEQIPGTSIYTSGDIVKQFSDLLNTFRSIGAAPLISLAVVLFGAALMLRRGRPAFGPDRVRGIVVSVASLLAYSLFFLINNTMNGFVYSVILPIPVLLGVFASQSASLRALFPFAVLFTAFSSVGGMMATPERDPLLREERFLEALLRPGDVLVVPGSPFSEILYLRRFNILMAGDHSDPSTSWVPQCRSEELAPRVAEILAQGRKVYFALGDFPAESPGRGDDNGAQKRRQVFWVAEPRSPETRRQIGIIRRELAAAFVLRCAVVSPQGWSYCGVRLRTKTEAGRAPRPPGPAPVSHEQLDVLSRLRSSDFENKDAYRRIRYLRDWLAEAPGDVSVQRELRTLLRTNRPPRRAPGMEESRVARSSELHRRAMGYQERKDYGAALRILEQLRKEFPLNARFRSDRGVLHALAGDKKTAISDLEAAIRLDGRLPSAYLSLGVIFTSLGQPRKALDLYDRALLADCVRIDPATCDQILAARDELRARLPAQARGKP